MNKNFIEDRIIDLELEKIRKSSKNITILDTATSQLMKMNRDVISLMIPENANDLLSFVINDNSSETEGGGNHWSVLTYSKKTQKFTIFDSLRGFNDFHAERLAMGIAKYFNVSSPVIK